MFKNVSTCSVCIIFLVSYITGLESGSECKINGAVGKCLPAHECLSARESFNKNHTLPIICAREKEVYVCCANHTVPEVPSTTTRRPTDDCEPLTSVPSPEIGQKSWNKCLEYQEKIMRPCTDILFAEGKFRSSKCQRESLALILLEKEVREDDFPHMVLLGYGNSISSLNWLSEGVIISERFILASAAVTFHFEHGLVKYVRTGVLNISDAVDESRLFKIKRIVRHPLFKNNKSYNDIALLETENEIPLGLSAMPACIDVGNLPSYAHALALGWDVTDRKKSMLQRDHFFQAASSDACLCFDACVLAGDRDVFDNATQICYGNSYDKKGDHEFEHVLQIEHIKCMHVVIGLSFRPYINNAGRRFTRVSAFVPWIESVVWP